MLRRFFVEPWQRIADETEPRTRMDMRVPATLITVALILLFEEYVGDRDFFWRHFDYLSSSPDYELLSYGWWVGSKLIGYVLVPLAILRVAKIPLSVMNLSTAGFVGHLRTYFRWYLIALPIIAIASTTQAFQATYPFYRLAARSWRDLFAWELLYAGSFVALELFFRGFILGMLRRSLGPYAIFVMIVPYCMIHFGKPAIEATGAIFAGIALGTLAMTTRSIWGGVIIHVSIAWTMDLLSLLQTTGLPKH